MSVAALCAMPWSVSFRADQAVRVMADRHYNRQAVGATQFVPPGICVVLAAPHAFWVSSWPRAQYVRHAWAGAWMCTAFRREAGECASDLIRAAVAATRARWQEVPSLGMVTFVDPAKVRANRDPGRCYLRAGFRRVGVTAGGLLALQLLPCDMPAAQPARGQQLELLS